MPTSAVGGVRKKWRDYELTYRSSQAALHYLLPNRTGSAIPDVTYGSAAMTEKEGEDGASLDYGRLDPKSKSETAVASEVNDSVITSACQRRLGHTSVPPRRMQAAR